MARRSSSSASFLWKFSSWKNSYLVERLAYLFEYIDSNYLLFGFVLTNFSFVGIIKNPLEFLGREPMTRLYALSLSALLLPWTSNCEDQPKRQHDLTIIEQRLRNRFIWLYSKPAELYFSKTEVTVAQYQECILAGVCGKPQQFSTEYQCCNMGNPDRRDHPVNCVVMKQAKTFCEWLGGRLPSDDEWYAEASNNGKRKYPWGDDKPTCELAVIYENGNGCGRESTWPVCSKLKGNSISGLCDMCGNVWEWTKSWYSKEDNYRTLRGGGFFRGPPGSLETTFSLGFGENNYSDILAGFRCVK